MLAVTELVATQSIFLYIIFSKVNFTDTVTNFMNSSKIASEIRRGEKWIGYKVWAHPLVSLNKNDIKKRLLFIKRAHKFIIVVKSTFLHKDNKSKQILYAIYWTNLKCWLLQPTIWLIYAALNRPMMKKILIKHSLCGSNFKNVCSTIK